MALGPTAAARDGLSGGVEFILGNGGNGKEEENIVTNAFKFWGVERKKSK